MKKVTLFIVVIAMITCSRVDAAIITVDNKTPSIGNYTTLQTAHDAATNGDTIYVYPSGAVYNGITVTKRLAFVGTGFDYPSEGMNTTSLTGTMTFGAGSDGSKLEGFGRSGSFYVTIDADNITIKRNKIHRITVSENHTGTVILQNYLYDSIMDYLITVDNSNEVLIANNILVNPYQIGSSSCCASGHCIGASSSTITITILHNVLYNRTWGQAIRVIDSNAYAANNIILWGYCHGSRYYYNMHSCGAHWDGENNIENVDMNNVFVDPDRYDFHLLPDSPAIGAGQNGVDMGIYGGSTPFVDGGAPSLPSIVQLQSDHVGSQQSGLDVTIKAKSNKE